MSSLPKWSASLNAIASLSDTVTMPKGPARPYKRGRIWWIKFYNRGVPQYESSKSTKFEDAARLLKRRQGEVEAGKAVHGRVTVGVLLEEMLQFYRLNRPKSYDDFAKPYTKRLKRIFGDLQAHQITTGTLRNYQERRLKEGAAKATVNREMALLRRSYHLGMEATPPLVAVAPRFPMLPENNVRRGFVAPEDYAKLKAEMPAELLPLLIVGYHVGCRRGELLPIRVDQIDIDSRQIRLHAGTTKNDEGRVLPIYGEMIETISRQLAQIKERWPSCRHLFHRSGKPILDFREAWESACERAGMPGLLFHDLRRSAVRNMVRAGVPEKVAMAISGHKTREVFDRYNIVDERDVAEAGRKTGEYLRKANKKKK